MKVVLRMVEQWLLVCTCSSAALWPLVVVIWLVSGGLLLVLVTATISIGVVLVVDAGRLLPVAAIVCGLICNPAVGGGAVAERLVRLGRGAGRH